MSRQKKSRGIPGSKIHAARILILVFVLLLFLLLADHDLLDASLCQPKWALAVDPLVVGLHFFDTFTAFEDVA